MRMQNNLNLEQLNLEIKKSKRLMHAQKRLLKCSVKIQKYLLTNKSILMLTIRTKAITFFHKKGFLKVKFYLKHLIKFKLNL